MTQASKRPSKSQTRQDVFLNRHLQWRFSVPSQSATPCVASLPARRGVLVHAYPKVTTARGDVATTVPQTSPPAQAIDAPRVPNALTTARSLFAALNQRDVSAVLTLLSEDVQYDNLGASTSLRGRGPVGQFYLEALAALPDDAVFVVEEPSQPSPEGGNGWNGSPWVGAGGQEGLGTPVLQAGMAWHLELNGLVVPLSRGVGVYWADPRTGRLARIWDNPEHTVKLAAPALTSAAWASPMLRGLGPLMVPAAASVSSLLNNLTPWTSSHATDSTAAASAGISRNPVATATGLAGGVVSAITSIMPFQGPTALTPRPGTGSPVVTVASVDAGGGGGARALKPDASRSRLAGGATVPRVASAGDSSSSGAPALPSSAYSWPRASPGSMRGTAPGVVTSGSDSGASSLSGPYVAAAAAAATAAAARNSTASGSCAARGADPAAAPSTSASSLAPSQPITTAVAAASPSPALPSAMPGSRVASPSTAATAREDSIRMRALPGPGAYGGQLASVEASFASVDEDEASGSAADAAAAGGAFPSVTGRGVTVAGGSAGPGAPVHAPAATASAASLSSFAGGDDEENGFVTALPFRPSSSLLKNLTGLWEKDAEASQVTEYETLLDVLELGGLQKMTARLIDGLDLQQDEGRFEVGFVTVVPFFRVTETSRFGSPSTMMRRDLRSGRQTSLATHIPGGVQVDMSWEAPLAGSLREEYRLSEDGQKLAVTSHLRIRQRAATATQVYRRSRRNKSDFLASQRSSYGSLQDVLSSQEKKYGKI